MTELEDNLTAAVKEVEKSITRQGEAIGAAIPPLAAGIAATSVAAGASKIPAIAGAGAEIAGAAITGTRAGQILVGLGTKLSKAFGNRIIRTTTTLAIGGLLVKGLSGIFGDKQLTQAENEIFFKEGIITEEEYRASLKKADYSPQDIERFVTFAKKGIAEAQPEQAAQQELLASSTPGQRGAFKSEFPLETTGKTEAETAQLVINRRMEEERRRAELQAQSEQATQANVGAFASRDEFLEFIRKTYGEVTPTQAFFFKHPELQAENERTRGMITETEKARFKSEQELKAEEERRKKRKF